MRTVAIVVVAVALLGLSLGWLLDRRGGGSSRQTALHVPLPAPRLRRRDLRLVGGGIGRHHDALHLVFATILGLFMIWSIFMAGVFAWGSKRDV